MLNMIPYHLAKVNKHSIDHLKHRVIVFVIPDTPVSGIQHNEIRFPFDGKIVDVSASCSTTGQTDTFIRVEKISLEYLDDESTSSTGWEEVVTDVVINYGRKTNSINPVSILSNEVTKNDYFRIVLDTVGFDIKNLTVEVVIEVTL